MQATIKKSLPDILIIVLFAIFSFGYFAGPLMDGHVLNMHDVQSNEGAVHEIKEFQKETGELSRWTNSMFGGMPTYQIAPGYDSTNLVKQAQRLYTLFMPSPVSLVFMMLLGFYILLRAMRIRPLLALLGAFMYGLSSYFFILIQAGHLWKFFTLAYIPPMIGGMLMIYRQKYLTGAVITTFFFAMQLISNHFQMTYYFGFLILFMVICFFIDAIRKKELPAFFKSSFVFLAASIIGILINISTLYHTQEYSKNSTRGKAELVIKGANNADDGLERAYIVHWSYGIDETMTLLIPNAKGGSSGKGLAEAESATAKADQSYVVFYQMFRQYFGSQPMTNGPVYVGAFVLALFILGLFLVKGPLKWALLAGTIFSIMLAWGKNFMGLTDFFLDYIPMYNKFRAVTSILVIAEFTIPLLAILCLKEIWENPSILKTKSRYVYISLGLTAGICLIYAIMPQITGDFVNDSDREYLQNLIAYFKSVNAGQMQDINAVLSNPVKHTELILANLAQIRMNIVSADAWRSFFIILIGSILLLSIRYWKVKPEWAIAGILILCVADMTGVDKRYLNNNHFSKKQTGNTPIQPTAADLEILKDKDPNYRVLNCLTSVDAFQDGFTSYFHKSIGGYHAAKLRRYQDMISVHLAKEKEDMMRELIAAGGRIDSVNADKFKALNMLNTKYFIVNGRNAPFSIRNPHAYGNAWFVDDIVYVNTPNEEIFAINDINLQKTAIVDSRFKEATQGVQQTGKDPEANIKLTEYKPNKLTYTSSSGKDGIAVFSEVYYPNGWHVSIDGKEVSHFRTNYILRGLFIPEGQHTIVFEFKPTSIKVTETIAYIAIAIMLIGVVVILVCYFRRQKQRTGNSVSHF